MSIKLVAIDLDDTLLGSDLQISSQCIDIIRKVQDLGVMVTIATGRMFLSALPYAAQIGVSIPLITYQGALVRSLDSNEVLLYKPLKVSTGLEIMKYFKQADIHFQGYYSDQLVMESYGPDGQDYVALARVTPLIVEDILLKAAQEPALKILAVIHDESLLFEMAKELNCRFGEEISITRSKPFFLEIMNKGVNKGVALETLADYYRLQAHEVMACGDSYNDIEMISWAGVGVAMKNGPDKVKQIADYVTKSNDEEGVSEALRKFVLGE